MPARLLNTKEIAERLGIVPSLVRVYCREGRIQATKKGRDWVATEAAVARFAAKERQRGRPAKTTTRRAS